MNIMKRSLIALAGTAVLTVGLAAPAAQADDYKVMKAQALEQAVLRAQMPTTLGEWEQYYYFDESDRRYTQPTVCWGAKGPVTLPRSKNMGSVNYQVDQNTNGSITIYQYANAKLAAKALASLRTALNKGCDGAPMVPTEDGTMVKGDQGFDQSDAKVTGITASTTYVDGDVRGYVSTKSTMRGVQLVITQVRQYVKTPQTMTQQQDGLGRVGDANNAWHPQAIKAVESFGQGNAR